MLRRVREIEAIRLHNTRRPEFSNPHRIKAILLVYLKLIHMDQLLSRSYAARDGTEQRKGARALLP
jgi:hypothetical protein